MDDPSTIVGTLNQLMALNAVLTFNGSIAAIPIGSLFLLYRLLNSGQSGVPFAFPSTGDCYFIYSLTTYCNI